MKHGLTDLFMLSPTSLNLGYSSDVVLVTKGVVSIMEKSGAELLCENGKHSGAREGADVSSESDSGKHVGDWTWATFSAESEPEEVGVGAWSGYSSESKAKLSDKATADGAAGAARAAPLFLAILLRA